MAIEMELPEAQLVRGPRGYGVTGLELVDGDHSPGSVDTYRINFEKGGYDEFPVYNGADAEIVSETAQRAIAELNTAVEEAEDTVAAAADAAEARAEAARDTVPGDYTELSDTVAGLESSIDTFYHVSSNVFDKSTVINNAYIGLNGIIQTNPSYALWFISDYIDVKGATSLQANIGLKSIIIYNEGGTIDSDNSYAGLHTSATLPFALPATADKIRISGYMTELSQNVMMNFGSELLPYEEYGNKTFDKAILKNSLEENPVAAKINNASTASNYLSSCKQALKKNVVVAYSANFTAFTSLLIGFTRTNNYASGYTDYLEITATDFVLHRAGLDNITWQHGLTIRDYLGVTITFDFAMNFTATLTTNGGVYTKSNYFYLGASYYPFAVITGTSVTGNKLSFSCKDFRRNIMMFGDSYFSNSPARWTYYFTDAERNNLCINGYAGESSASAVADFDTLVNLGSPKYVVWCLGMNDGSDTDDTTPSSAWLTALEHVLEVCNERNITPILATIPSVPTINNRAKSDYVRNSGYAYIDFARAVNSNSDGDWYSGLLSQDGVHPTDDGARVLFARAITDFPDLLINN